MISTCSFLVTYFGLAKARMQWLWWYSGAYRRALQNILCLLSDMEFWWCRLLSRNEAGVKKLLINTRVKFSPLMNAPAFVIRKTVVASKYVGLNASAKIHGKIPKAGQVWWYVDEVTQLSYSWYLSFRVSIRFKSIVDTPRKLPLNNHAIIIHRHVHRYWKRKR